jgi:short subunit dehydrogenase-like uncharacterized protein
VSDRTYAVTLLGATGFTGRLTAAHLARRLAGTTTSWAIAGRDRAKLEALRDELPGDPGVVVADVTDPDSLLTLARSTDVLATTVGPYATYGEPVVEACVEAATEYCDITGEPDFVRSIRDRFDGPAREAGIRLVSCCGFDSVPHDLGVRFTVAQLPDDAPTTLRGYVHMTGQLSGGTAASAVNHIANRSFLRRKGRSGAGVEPVREVSSVRPLIHRVPELDAWGVPLPTIDQAIVLRSARQLDGYGERFRYGHFAEVGSLPVVAAGVAALGGMAAMASLPPTRALLERVLPDPGEGPSEERRARSRFRVTFLGEAGNQRVVTRVAGGDPGYDETAKMLGEAALSLAQDGKGEALGHCTPAVALGEHYQSRLEHQGLTFEVLETTIAPATS